MKSGQSNFNLRLPGSYLVFSYLITTILFIQVLVSSRFRIVGPVWAVAVGKSKKSSKSQIQSSQNVSLTLFVQFRNLISKVVRHSKTQKNVRSK